MKTSFLITARLKSTRLPKKVIKTMHGKPMIIHMLDRLKLAKELDEIIICTSEDPQDDPLEIIAQQEGVKCFRGDPVDVVARLYGAAKYYQTDYILNITADCPFVDPFYIDKIVECYKKTGADLIRAWDLPHGVFSYGVKPDALQKVINIKDSSDTEVWYNYFSDTTYFNVIDLDISNKFYKRPGLRMTIDYPEDWQFLKVIFDALYKDGNVFTLNEILSFIDDNPEVVDINRKCHHQFKKRYVTQADIKLKKMQSIKSAIVIGCGSIGQRHIKNLQALGINSIITLRSRKGHYKKLPKDIQVKEVETWDDVINEKPDIAIIANPTIFHLEYVTKLITLVKGIFIEKPLSNSLSGIDQLLDLQDKSKTILFMGHNLLFHPIVTTIKDIMSSNDIGNMLNIQFQFGQWLPDWHPYEDYTKAYYARKDLGGGVALTLIHEIQLAMEFAGEPVEVCGMVSKSELLNLDVDVITDAMIRHKSGCISQIHLDYIQKPPHRSGLISFERAWMAYDFTESHVIAQLPGQKEPVVVWSVSSYDVNQMYIDQMKKFIQYVEEGRMKHPYDINSGIDSLKLVDALFTSNEQKQNVKIYSNKKFKY